MGTLSLSQLPTQLCGSAPVGVSDVTSRLDHDVIAKWPIACSMLGGGGGSVFAVPESCMDHVSCPSKRSLSLSLGQKGRRSKVPKFDPVTSNGSRDLFDSKASSRAVAVSQNLTGLTNVANTCYANAVVQALRFCPGFREGLARACSASLSTSGPHPIAASLLQVGASNPHNSALCSIHSFPIPFTVVPTYG